MDISKADFAAKLKNSGRTDGRKFNELLSFTITAIENDLGSSSVFFESEETKFICSINGPMHSRQSSTSFDCEIKVNINNQDKESELKKEKDEADIRMNMDIKNIFEQIIVREKYPRCVIQINFQIVTSKGCIKQHLINAASFSLIRASINMYDRPFASSTISIGSELLVDPSEEEQKNATRTLLLVRGAGKGEIIFIDFDGESHQTDIEKIYDLGIEASKEISKYINSKIDEILA